MPPKRKLFSKKLLALVAILIVIIVSVSLRTKRITISGGVWVTKGSGASDVLRGLDIYLCKAELPLSTFVDGLSKLDATLKAKITIEEELAESVKFTKAYKTYKDMANKYRRYHQVLQQMLERNDTAKISLLDLYNYFAIAGKENELFPRIILASMVQKVTTNVEGKYVIEKVPRGQYVIFSYYGTKSYIIRWMLPVDVSGSEDMKVDLFNENSLQIINLFERSK